ncbi:unnamed protein product [Closterium sp. NIES-53]
MFPSGGVGPCTYVLRTNGHRGETCGLPHTAQRYFGRLTDAWRAQFPDAVELPRWGDLLKHNVAIFDLDFDAILAAMYAVTDSAKGDCDLCVPPDPGIEAAALGASESAAPDTTPDTFATAPHSRRAVGLSQSPWLTPLGAQSLRTLPRGADLQDLWVDQFTRGGQRVTHCTCSRTGRHLATFTRRPGSSLYTLTTASPPVTASGQVAASGQVFFAASRSLPPLPPGPAPTCVPCVEGRQRAAPHSSEFPPTEAPLQTLHMDVWGLARVRGQCHERYFLLVVDDYSCYTTIFPLHRKDRGGEFSSDLLRAFCRAQGIRQTFTLPASPQQNGIAERRIGMVMYVARTSMIHAATPHFLWPSAVQYAAHQIILQPRVSLPETTPTLRWTGKLSSRAVPCVFLGFPPDAPGWQFYHPTLHRVLSSQDVTFDESVSYYHPVEPVKVAVDSGAARGAEPASAGPGGAEPGVAESEGAEPGGAEPERVEPRGAEPGGVEPERADRAAGATGPAAGGASGAGATGGAAGAGAAGAAGPGGAGAVRGPAGVGAARVAGATGPGGARTGGTGAAGAGGAARVGAVGSGAVATRDSAGAGAARGTGAGGDAGVVAGELRVLPQSRLQPASPLPGPSPYSRPTRGLTERREPESRPASPESHLALPESRPKSRVRTVRTGRRVSR